MVLVAKKNGNFNSKRKNILKIFKKPFLKKYFEINF